MEINIAHWEEEYHTDQEIIEFSEKEPFKVFSCDDGRIAIGGKILSKEEAEKLDEQARFLKDVHENPKAFRIAIKIANVVDFLNPLNWFARNRN